MFLLKYLYCVVQGCIMAAMAEETTISIKQEEMDDIPNDPDSMLLDDPVGVYWSTDHINEDSKLNFGWDENENNNVVVNTLLHTILEAESECCPPPLLVPKKELFHDDTLRISCPTGFIKEDPELNLEADETDNIMPNTSVVDHMESGWIKNDDETNEVCSMVATATGFECDSSWLIQHSSESCYITSEETVKQEVVPGELEIGAGESMSFAMFGIHTQQAEEEEESLLGIRLKFSLRNREFQKFCCNSCLQSFPSKYKLIMHVFIHIDGVQPPTYVCKSCGEVFSSNISLNRHVKMNAGVQAPFDDNNYKIGQMYKHENIVEGDEEVSVTEQTEKQSSKKDSRRIARKFCNDSYNTDIMTTEADKRDRHSNYGSTSIAGNVNHGAVIPTYKCDVCGKAFTQLEHLKRHGLTHATVTSYTCNTCGKTFQWLCNLKQHSLKHTGSKPHKCDICGKSFTLLRILKQHSIIHTGSKPHKCYICGKSFTSLGNLKQHSLIHTGIKQHECDLCGNSFTRLSYLKQHSLIHSGSKPYKCDICGKSFTWLSNLKRHCLIHTR